MTLDPGCAPYADFLKGVMMHGRVAAMSPAFEQCMGQRLRASYRPCTGDPYHDSSIDVQIQKAIAMSRSANGVAMTCDDNKSAGNASTGDNLGYDHTKDERFTWHDWLVNGAAPALLLPSCTPFAPPDATDCRRDPWPYSQAAGIAWHEASHTHGYQHGINNISEDPQGAGRAACGIPATTDFNFQVNTMPYLIQSCIGDVIDRSGSHCGGILQTCGPGRLRIIDDFNGTTCHCADDPNPGIGPPPPASPLLLGLSQSSGNIGDSITLYGLGFDSAPGATQVSFVSDGLGSIAARPAMCSPAAISPFMNCVVVVPPGTGLMDVRVTVNGLTSPISPGDRFQYKPPIVNALTPSSGPWTGGTTVLLTGKGFSNYMQVYFNGSFEEWLSCVGSTQCYVGTPNMRQPGPVKVIVSSFGDNSATWSGNVFTATAAPALMSLWIGDDPNIKGTWPDPRVIGGKTTYGCPQLDGYALPGGAVISLSSSDPATASVPATMTMRAGSNGTGPYCDRFQVTTAAVSANKPVTITATYQGVSASQNLLVVTPGAVCTPRKCPRGQLWDPQLCRCGPPM